MKLFKKIRKGFTLIELVVVIAVIAILSAVAVVSYVSITNKAKQSNDQQKITQVNLALKAQGVSKAPSTMHEALNGVREDGFIPENLKAESKDYTFAYTLEDNMFVILDKNMSVVYPEKHAEYQAKDLWLFADSKAEVEATATKAYNHYLRKDVGEVALVTETGLDVGENEQITTISYSTADTKKVVIRTNGGTLIIDGKNSIVNHYGEGLVLNIEKIASASYHEYGHFPKASIKEGKIVVENNAEIEILNVTGSGVKLEEKSSGSIGLCYASSSENTPTVTGGTVDVKVEEIDFDNIVARTSFGVFTSLHEALEDLQAQGQKLYIVANITETMEASSGQCLYTKTGNFDIDGQGHTINASFVVNNADTKIFFCAENGVGSIVNLKINSTGIKYVFDVSTGGELSMRNVSIHADNCCITSDSGGVVNATDCEFFFTKGEHTRDDFQESWAPVSTQYGAEVNLEKCNLQSTDGYGLLIWPSGGFLNVSNCSIINAKGLAISWIGNGADNTKSDSIIRINNTEVIGGTACIAKCNTESTFGHKAEVYIDDVLVAYHAAHATAAECPDNN